jgi:hypothetical protein
MLDPQGIMDRLSVGGCAVGPLAAVAMIADTPTLIDVATNFASFIFAMLRICGVKNNIYKAFAHVWVGGIGGAWLVNHDRGLGIQFVALCVVEVGVAGFTFYESRVAGKNGKPPADLL